MKRILLLAASCAIMLSVSAQTDRNMDDHDPTAPKVGYPTRTVDTPHFQSAPAEGVATGGDADRYCGSMVGSRIAVIYKGKTIIDSRTFMNGTVVFKDGTVIFKTGERRKLKSGECLDSQGNAIM